MATTQYIQAANIDPAVKAVLETLKADMLTNSVNATAVQTDLDATEATIVTDLGNLRTAINNVVTKLNVNAGVAESDFAAAPAITTA
jgi:hypothetical protein